MEPMASRKDVQTVSATLRTEGFDAQTTPSHSVWQPNETDRTAVCEQWIAAETWTLDKYRDVVMEILLCEL